MRRVTFSEKITSEMNGGTAFQQKSSLPSALAETCSRELQKAESPTPTSIFEGIKNQTLQMSNLQQTEELLTNIVNTLFPISTSDEVSPEIESEIERILQTSLQEALRYKKDIAECLSSVTSKLLGLHYAQGLDLESIDPTNACFLDGEFHARHLNLIAKQSNERSFFLANLIDQKPKKSNFSFSEVVDALKALKESEKAIKIETAPQKCSLVERNKQNIITNRWLYTALEGINNSEHFKKLHEAAGIEELTFDHGSPATQLQPEELLVKLDIFIKLATVATQKEKGSLQTSFENSITHTVFQILQELKHSRIKDIPVQDVNSLYNSFMKLCLIDKANYEPSTHDQFDSIKQQFTHLFSKAALWQRASLLTQSIPMTFVTAALEIQKLAKFEKMIQQNDRISEHVGAYRTLNRNVNEIFDQLPNPMNAAFKAALACANKRTPNRDLFERRYPTQPATLTRARTMNLTPSEAHLKIMSLDAAALQRFLANQAILFGKERPSPIQRAVTMPALCASTTAVTDSLFEKEGSPTKAMSDEKRNSEIREKCATAAMERWQKALSELKTEPADKLPGTDTTPAQAHGTQDKIEGYTFGSRIFFDKEGKPYVKVSFINTDQTEYITKITSTGIKPTISLVPIEKDSPLGAQDKDDKKEFPYNLDGITEYKIDPTPPTMPYTI